MNLFTDIFLNEKIENALYHLKRAEESGAILSFSGGGR